VAAGLIAVLAACGSDRVGSVVAATAASAAVSPAQRIPAAAKVVTITHVPGSGPQPAGDVPVTITNPAAVARIALIVDGLPVFPPGIRNCPLDNGSGMRLTFRTALSDPALAVVTAQSGGCGAVAVTISGRPMRTLGDAPSLQHQVAAVAGLRWPAGQVPSPDGPTTPAAAPTPAAA
jgi:hypothetical protein